MIPSAGDIAARSVRGSLFNIGASVFTLISGFVRTVLLLRWLQPEQFGLFTLALFYLSLVTQLNRLGLRSAYIHRQDDTETTRSTFAGLHLALTAVAVILAVLAAPWLQRFYVGYVGLGVVMITLAVFEMVRGLNTVAEAMLIKRLDFKRLAALDVISSLAMTLIAPAIAWAGGGVWALVAEQAVGISVRLAGLWFYHPPWRINLRLDRTLVRWYVDFGKHIFASANLIFLLDQFDDFWTGTFLGKTALGYYSRAYEFARYPRRVVANPVAGVALSTFARLQADRQHLSKAYFRVSSLVVRVGFLLGGVFALIMPEFVATFLNADWRPMIPAFRLMLIYTLLDPLLVLSGQLMTAVGRPQVLPRVRLLQLLVFVPSVWLAGRIWGINGVALAADLMLCVGGVLLLPSVRAHVDFSLARMIGPPLIGITLGLSTALLLARLLTASPLLMMFGKGFTTTILFVAVLLLFERHELLISSRAVLRYLRPANTGTFSW